jgi:hypothetical protein
MPDIGYPGVYVEEIGPGGHAIHGVSTTIAAFVGFAQSGPFTPLLIESAAEYAATFGGFGVNEYLALAVHGFFLNGGTRCHILRLPGPPPPASDTASLLIPLDTLDDVSIVCCPDEHALPCMTAALVARCESHKDRIALLAAPLAANIAAGPPKEARSSFAAYYLPWVMVENPAGGAPLPVHPGGHVAGAIVRNDLQRGAWKKPANLPLLGIVGLEKQITDQELEDLSALGVNVLRNLPGRGSLIWGGRTTSKDPEWKYVNVRRYLIYLEKSIDQGLQWVVFEPNGPQLWCQVKASVSNFLYNEWITGALQGNSPEQSFFVHCDATTMTQDDIDNGRLICLIGVAVLRPAEFVIFQIGKNTAAATCP